MSAARQGLLAARATNAAAPSYVPDLWYGNALVDAGWSATGPGDALYIPVGWWPQVAAIEFGVMLTYTGFRWPDDASERFPAN